MNYVIKAVLSGCQHPEYGRYMIQESGRFEFDENLEGFYNYKQYGEQMGGQS